MRRRRIVAALGTALVALLVAVAPPSARASSVLTEVRAAAGSVYATCAVRDDGSVWCWGTDESGQLGNAAAGDSFTATRVVGVTGAVGVAGGSLHFCAVTAAGRVWCWGSNGGGQLGLGPGGPPRSEVAVEVPGLTGVVQVSAGATATCALTREHTVWCWGVNADGQLGDGTLTARSSPTQVVGLPAGVQEVGVGLGTTTCARLANGTLRCWGGNRSGLLGNGSTAKWAVRPVRVAPLPRPATSLSVGLSHACARLEGGSVWCWGSGLSGALGTGGTASSGVPVRSLVRGASGVAAGQDHTCARTGLAVTCWGVNQNGQLGDGTREPRLEPVTTVGITDALRVVEGTTQSCVVLRSRQLRCWGLNVLGQLGDGTRDTSLLPVRVLVG